MQTTFIVMKVMAAIFGMIKNIAVGITNFFISIWNNYIRKRNDKIKRGVTEIKQSSIDNLVNSEITNFSSVVSGGNNSSRAAWIARFTNLAYSKGYPVVVLHEDNEYIDNELNTILGTNYLSISNGSKNFEPFSNMTSNEISKLILDTATDDYDLKKNARYYIEGMVEFLQCKNVSPTLYSFYSCPYFKLFDSIDNLAMTGKISDAKAQSIKQKLMMGQSEQCKLESLFTDLFQQGENVFYDKKSRVNYNVKNCVEKNKVVAFNISSNSNNLLINLIVAQMKQILNKGQSFVLIADNISSVNNEKVKKFITENSNNCQCIISNQDVFSMIGGEEKVFNTLVGISEQIIILRHASGATCNRWAESIGYYDKEEESQSFSTGKMKATPFSLFSGSNTTQQKSYSIKREYIIKPEEINRMTENEVYLYRHTDNKLIHTFY